MLVIAITFIIAVYTITVFQVHAKYLVKCLSTLASINPLDLAALSRVGSQVKKDILIAIVPPDSFVPYYLAMSWWKG